MHARFEEGKVKVSAGAIAAHDCDPHLQIVAFSTFSFHKFLYKSASILVSAAHALAAPLPFLHSKLTSQDEIAFTCTLARHHTF